jgi:hypothetical protein
MEAWDIIDSGEEIAFDAPHELIHCVGGGSGLGRVTPDSRVHQFLLVERGCSAGFAIGSTPRMGDQQLPRGVS